jgi:hypothetical protein
MTNTAGALPGIIGVVTTGAILDQTGSWPLALFVPSIFFFVTGAVCSAPGGQCLEALPGVLACIVLLVMRSSPLEAQVDNC